LCTEVQLINISFNTQQVYVKKNVDEFIIHKPREYQTDAYNLLKNLKSAVLTMPCGMGKSRTAIMLASQYPNILLVSPLRVLAQQLLYLFAKYLGDKYEPILISSDGLRNEDKISKLLKDKNIISCTFDSVDVALKVVSNLAGVYVIVDEFHNLSPANITSKTDHIYKLLNNDKFKKLYMSATPLANFKSDAQYSYQWNDAIKNKYICDFKFVLPDIDDKLEKFKLLLGEIDKDIDFKMYCKAYFIVRSMLFYANKKCIAYLTSIDKAELFLKCVDIMSKLMNVKINTWQIDCNTSKTKREDILSGFKTSTDVAMIVNVHILDEGVNIDDCDSVFVAQPNDNIANLVQRMSRGNRITPNKNVCYVYLWAVQNKVDAILDYIMNNTANFAKDKVFKMNFDKPVVKVGKHIIVKPVVEIISESHKSESGTESDSEDFERYEKAEVVDEKPKKVGKFYCIYCDYSTTTKQSLKIHNRSKKHITNAKENGKFPCEYCGTVFPDRMRKWRHMQKCSEIPEKDKIENEIKKATKDVTFINEVAKIAAKNLSIKS
jgi:superfamily II DNA or RNA helicase